MARVLMVQRAGEGGAFEHVTSLSAGLARLGHEVAICGPHAADGDAAPVEVIPLAISRPLSPRADLRALAELGRIARRFRADVVHGHDSKGGALARAGRLRAPRTPVVFTPHGFAFAGHFSRGSERLAYRLIERGLTPLASRVICVCEAEARLARRVGAGRRVRVVHNGIEPPAGVRPDPSVAALRARGPVIAAVTGLRPGKGDLTLVRAFAALEASSGATLVIAGDGSERGAVERQIVAAGLGDRVRLAGEVPDVYALLAASDVFVLPSWAESFPYSVLEAMACGLPIVASEVGGIGEAIEDGRSGLLVPPRDEAALARALGELLADRNRARTLGDRARSRLLERFTLSRMIDGTLSVYRELGIDA